MSSCDTLLSYKWDNPIIHTQTPQPEKHLWWQNETLLMERSSVYSFAVSSGMDHNNPEMMKDTSPGLTAGDVYVYIHTETDKHIGQKVAQPTVAPCLFVFSHIKNTQHCRGQEKCIGISACTCLSSGDSVMLWSNILGFVCLSFRFG